MVVYLQWLWLLCGWHSQHLALSCREGNPFGWANLAALVTVTDSLLEDCYLLLFLKLVEFP